MLLYESISTTRHWPDTDTSTDTDTKHGFGACSDFCRCRLCIGHEMSGLDLDKTHVVLTSCQMLARCRLPRKGLSLNNELNWSGPIPSCMTLLCQNTWILNCYISGPALQDNGKHQYEWRSFNMGCTQNLGLLCFF